MITPQRLAQVAQAAPYRRAEHRCRSTRGSEDVLLLLSAAGITPPSTSTWAATWLRRTTTALLVASALLAGGGATAPPAYAYNCVNVVLRDPYWGSHRRIIQSGGVAAGFGAAFARNGFVVNNTPSVGAIMVWPAGYGGASGAGHVGIVTGVNGNGTVAVRHENWPYGRAEHIQVFPVLAGHRFVHRAGARGAAQVAGQAAPEAEEPSQSEPTTAIVATTPEPVRLEGAPPPAGGAPEAGPPVERGPLAGSLAIPRGPGGSAVLKEIVVENDAIRAALERLLAGEEDAGAAATLERLLTGEEDAGAAAAPAPSSAGAEDTGGPAPEAVTAGSESAGEDAVQPGLTHRPAEEGHKALS